MPAEAFVVEIPLLARYQAAAHTLTHRRGIIVEVSHGGLSGWGEFVELPGYSRETTETALASLTGAPVTHSNPMALSARSTAELDLQAKQRGLPLTGVLGGTAGAVASGAVVAHFGDVAGTIAEGEERIREGYRKLKVKIGPGFDIEPLTELRSRHPGALICADANGSYTPAAVPSALDEMGLLYLEQPFAPKTEWSAFARLRSDFSTPICLDESVTGLPTLRAAIAAAACDVVNIKPARLGGLGKAVELHDLAESAGIGLVVGGLLETGIGRAAALAVARLPGFSFPADLSASNRYWERDLTIPAWELTDGNLTVPEAPGIGVDIDLDVLDDVTLSRHSLPGRRASF